MLHHATVYYTGIHGAWMSAGSVAVRVQRRTMELIVKIQSLVVSAPVDESGNGIKGLRPHKSEVIHAAVVRYWEELRR